LPITIRIGFVLMLVGGTQVSIGNAAATGGGAVTTAASALPGSAGVSGSSNESGRDFYVSPSGSDDDPGTSPGTPWKTLT
jgi:hypothetical protein